MTDNDEIMTAREVADFLRINLMTVYNLVNKGKLPAIRVGRSWRFRRSDLEALFRQAAQGQKRSERLPENPAE